jgi:hypothetical protein
MKTKLVLLALLAYALHAGSQSAPDHCATIPYLKACIAEDPTVQARIQQIEAQTQEYIDSKTQRPGRFPFVTIPVVFHIVYNTAAENISDQTIGEQINIMNEDYNLWNADSVNIPAVWKPIEGNAHIHFCLASRDTLGNPTNGITRTSTAITSFANSPYDHKINYTSQGGANAWNRYHYLNIWVCNLGGGILGYTQMPGAGPDSRDGCVIHYTAVGVTGAVAPYNLGRTVTHEVGHWFNLIHPWGDDYGACSGTDKVADTPNEADANYSSYPPFTVRTDSCTPTAPGIMWQNFLDYTNDDGMCMFTAGQVQRMTAALYGPRDSILTSPALGPNGIGNETLNNLIKVFPSPSDGIIYLAGPAIPGKQVVNVFSITGQQLCSLSFDNADTLRTIDLHFLPDGVYLLQISTADQKATKKVIIRH